MKLPVKVVDQDRPVRLKLHLPICPSGADLSSSVLRFLSGLLKARRRERGTRRRRLTADRQALLALGHLRCGRTYAQLGAGFGVGIAIACRYIAETVEGLAALAPDLATAARTAARKAYS